jgi:hypothetical protein
LTTVLSVALAVTMVRSLVFVLFEQSFLGGDQPTFGITALHLSRGQAFPIYAYGMSYMLAVSVWPAAVFVALLGPTVLALKWPLLVASLVVVALLLRALTPDPAVRSPVAVGVERGEVGDPGAEVRVAGIAEGSAAKGGQPKPPEATWERKNACSGGVVAV